jgi:hypothetical protein
MKKSHRVLRFLISIFAPGYHLHKGKQKKEVDVEEEMKKAYEGK